MNEQQGTDGVAVRAAVSEPEARYLDGRRITVAELRSAAECVLAYAVPGASLREVAACFGPFLGVVEVLDRFDGKDQK